MSNLLAIDPGPEQSAYVFFDVQSGLPTSWGKVGNYDLLGGLHAAEAAEMAIEQIASYGMAVGAEIFATCVWSGRFIQRWLDSGPRGGFPYEIPRRAVKLHLCGSQRAKDSNIRQAIIDRYGPGKDRAVGVKASPGPLYGMKADCWQALGVGITTAETRLTTVWEAA